MGSHWNASCYLVGRDYICMIEFGAPLPTAVVAFVTSRMSIWKNHPAAALA